MPLNYDLKSSLTNLNLSSFLLLVSAYAVGPKIKIFKAERTAIAFVILSAGVQQIYKKYRIHVVRHTFFRARHFLHMSFYTRSMRYFIMILYNGGTGKQTRTKAVALLSAFAGVLLIDA